MSSIGQDRLRVPISIILTVYNGERYLDAAVQSILHQTIEEYELIVIDDGSTDGTKSLLESMSDRRVKPLFMKHTGRAHALNEGLKHAHAPIIAFMDADDVALPERLKEQHSVMQQCPEIGVVSSWYQLIDASGQRQTIRKLPEQHTDIEYEMTKHSSMCFPAAMVRRELFNKVDGFNEAYSSAIDYDLWLRLLPITKFYNLQKVLLQYRVHSHAISVERNHEQRKCTLRLAHAYLLKSLRNNRSDTDRYKILFRLGLNEYYHGSMPKARSWFVQAFPLMWYHWSWWRYWMATFLGDTTFSLYRSRL